MHMHTQLRNTKRNDAIWVTTMHLHIASNKKTNQRIIITKHWLNKACSEGIWTVICSSSSQGEATDQL